MSHPRLLLLDEPSAGLAPSIVQDVLEAVRRIKVEEGRTHQAGADNPPDIEDQDVVGDKDRQVN